MERTNIIERKVPMDIREYKMKVVGPFNIRQTIIIGIIIGLDIALYFSVIQPLKLSYETIMWIAFIIDMPLIMTGWFKIGDLSAERYLYYKFIHPIKTKRKRYPANVIYKRKETIYDLTLEKKEQKNLEAEMIAHPEYVPYE